MSLWDVVNEQNIPKGADIIDSTWVMKKKAYGDHQACLAAQGFKQTRENHSCTTIFCLLWYMISQCELFGFEADGWISAQLVDVNGAFLLGQFKRYIYIYENPIGIQKVLSILYISFVYHHVSNASRLP